MDAVVFYKNRDRRTIEYGIENKFYSLPICVSIGKDAAETYRGQILILSLINQLARLHRHICLNIPKVPLIINTTVLGATSEHMELAEGVISLAKRIDPFIKLETKLPQKKEAWLGIGSNIDNEIPWFIGSKNQHVFLSEQPISADCSEGFSLGAGFASCLGASTILHQILEKQISPYQFSAWALDHIESECGPSTLPPLDLGEVFMVGAGGVGSCLAYWLSFCDLKSNWNIVDNDIAELHNTNRCLGIFPDQTNWQSFTAGKKAEIAAEIANVNSCCKWYNELDQENINPDLILPLANERNCRSAISQRGEPILLHATTSSTWQAQLHRHIPYKDDCIVCRMPESNSEANFKCSEVTVTDTTQTSTDSALPFLSASAAIMLLAGLFRLQENDLNGRYNIWRACYLPNQNFMSPGVYPKCDNCEFILPKKAIRKSRFGI